MNKKKLSVVMAGAMLASSVAPVLAADTITATEFGISQKKLVAKEINDLVESGKISADSTLKTTDFVSTDVANLMKNTESIYGIKVLDKDSNVVDLNTKFGISNVFNGDNTLTYNIADIKTVLEHTDLTTDMTVQVVKRGSTTFLGQIIPGTEIKGTGVADTNKFKVTDFASLTALQTATGLTFASTSGTSTTVSGNDYIKSVKLKSDNTGATITLNALKNVANEKEGNVTIDLTTGSSKLYFALPLDKSKNLITDSDKVQDCVEFLEKQTYQTSSVIAGNPTVEKAYKFVDDSVSAEKVTYLASDLYDGLALTAKGTEIQSDINNAKKVAEETGKAATVVLDSTRPSALTSGVASFTVTYYDSYKDVATGATAAKKVVTIKSTNLKEIQSLYDMIDKGTYTVGIVAGDNRYETAVNVAKAQKLPKVTSANADDATKNNIVLVNGNSLVDGLAAAPLAANLKMNNSQGTAVLLSQTDKLPTATKEYLEELTSEIPTAKRKFVTINLVGGTSVLSNNLVDELEGMGFKVERLGGDNREETSLEVADVLVNGGTNNKAFVVGANGEADAMSIAAVAAKEGAPIIVSKNGGLSDDAVKFIKKNSSTATANDVAVIGGENVVSAKDYAKIDAVTTNKVARVAGATRFETNAKIIKEYAKSFTQVVLVKDGQSNKTELVDALSAASYAAKDSNAAPIVLAKDKITDAQKVAILDTKGTVSKLTQVGQGVARTTLESVAEFLGLSNVK